MFYIAKSNQHQMKQLFPVILLMLIVFTNALAKQSGTDTITREEFIHLQTTKSDTLNKMALKLAVPGANSKDLNEAINLIMKGLHTYARFRDSVGLRETFDHLALTYHLQKKYVQAKWFYIQSNSYARDMKDTANIIHSLVALSTVKADIKDFEMGDKDIAEALILAKTQRGINAEIEVQNTIAEYYTKRGYPKKIEAAINRVAFLNDSVAKRNAPPKIVRVKKPLPVAVSTKPSNVKSDNPNLIILVSVVILFILLLLLFLVKGGRKMGNNFSGKL